MSRLPTITTELVAFCLDRAMAVNAGPDLVLCRVLGCKPFYVPSIDQSMNPHVVVSGVWEASLTCFLTRLVQSGWRWADLGANVGYFSILLSELTSEQRGSAYEPNPIAAKILETNLRVNGCDRVRVVNAAVGVPGVHSMGLHRTPRWSGGSSFFESPYVDRDSHYDPEADIIDVPVVTLDGAGGLDIVKLDCEGMDLPIVLSWEVPPKHVVLEYAGKFPGVKEMLPRLFERWHGNVFLVDGEGFPQPAAIDMVRPMDFATLYLMRK